MNFQQKCLRLGSAVILLATVLKLFGGGFLPDMRQLLTQPSITKLLLYAGTGQVFDSARDPTTPPEVSQAVAAPAFSAQLAQGITLKNYPSIPVDTAQLLTAPLRWDLTVPEPTVLIYHSHACESYENTEGYLPSDYYRTLDTHYNMVSIGQALAEALRAQGITVLHDTTLHDHPSYNDAYRRSGETVRSYLAQYPSIRLVLDIHRDAYEDAQGNQASSTLTVDGVETARLMLLMGTNSANKAHSQWQENVALAVKLQATLQALCPGICRPTTLRASTFNQELSPGALLVEVGTAGDTRQAALAAVQVLAEAIGYLSRGANC